jgi:pimeloyl-ACP methyl ester carboxylesterase
VALGNAIIIGFLFWHRKQQLIEKIGDSMPYLTVSGRRLFYQEQGEGPLLFILPGNTASSACHPGELNYFSRRFRAVSIDFWGTGRSDRSPAWPVNWWEVAAGDITALIEHLGRDQGLLVGTSGGAAAALLAAILHPEKVKAVVADSEVEVYPLQSMQPLIADRSRRTADQVSFWRNAHGDDWEQVVEADSDMLLRFAARGGDFFHGRLREIRCPVLLTASLLDEMLPEVALQVPRMALQIPDCRVYFANQGAHPLMWSRPDEFRRIADDFLKGYAADRGR